MNSNYKEKINRETLPKHIAIIMDGNGRWAKKRGNQRIFGHRNAIAAVRDTVEASAELGVAFLTLFAFSTENWKRPKSEVDALMMLLVSTINSEVKTMNDNNVRLHAIGDMSKLPYDLQAQLGNAVKNTSANTGLNLILALSYSSRWEITEAAKSIAADVKSDKLDIDSVDSKVFSEHLATSAFPDPELMIRTSGEYRLSNFLLWQMAYTELYFTDILWPDFRRDHLYEAILSYQRRERRFGKTADQLNQNINVNN